MMFADRKVRSWGGSLLLLVAPGIVSAQDRPATGPSTAEPETNKHSPQNPPFGNRPIQPKAPDQVLPAVPATATDPAPPGTRSVRVDGPGAAVGANATRRPMANTMTVEGMVTAIAKKGNDLKNETIRITIDPRRGWETYAMGPSAAPADPAVAVPGSPEPQPIDIVLTGRTYTFAHARTADGVDLVGAATDSSPDDARLRSEALGSHMRLQRTSDPETSWTNIKDGSYVLVRYRKSGNVNEAINVSVIQLPLNPDAASAPAARPVLRSVAAPAAGTTTGNAPVVPETKKPTSPGVLP